MTNSFYGVGVVVGTTVVLVGVGVCIGVFVGAPGIGVFVGLPVLVGRISIPPIGYCVGVVVGVGFIFFFGEKREEKIDEDVFDCGVGRGEGDVVLV